MHLELLSKGKSELDKQALRDAIKKAWDTIREDTVTALIKSMDTRINSVITAEGWYTRF